jgi:Protein of unknown function (DUF3592)
MANIAATNQPPNNHTRRMNWAALRIAGLIFLALYGFLFYKIYPVWQSDEQLAHEGLSTTGVIIEKQPMNHQAIRYTYQVGTKSYTGVGPTSVANVPPFDQIAIGDRITVYYIPGMPETSIPGTPTYFVQSWGGLLFVILPVVCLGLSIAGGVWLRKLLAEN